MLGWGTIAYGAALSGVAAAAAVRLLLRERHPDVLVVAALSAFIAPFAWNSILRHTGGEFLVDAPIVVFPISFQDTGSGVFTVALSTLLLGFGPLRGVSGQRLALTAGVCGVAALLVDIYLY
jgi:hypothetical protein